MILTFKYRLKGKRAERQLRRYAWAANQVWNFCVQTQRKTQRTWKDGLSARWHSHFGLAKLAGGTSQVLGIHAQSIQAICAQFVKSRDQHRKCPAFRKSGGPKRSLGWIPFQEQSRQVEGNAITYLGNTYRFFGAKDRPLPESVRGGCFVEDSRGNWYVCLQVDVSSLPRASQGAVGIDLGLKAFATFSDGEKIEAPRIYRELQGKLGIAQRAGNKQRVKAINALIKNRRADFLHKESKKIAETYEMIFIGDVSSSRLARTNMAKSIYDVSWATFKGLLCYKASRHGGVFLEVSEKFSTQICSSCGILPETSPKGIADLGIREWSCTCGVHHDRDVNAARNILAFGQSALPLVEERRAAHGR